MIESQFTELLQKIDSSRDFEVIRQSHETFQASLLSQCFLLNMPVNHCLMCILDSCQSFSVLMESSANDELSVDQREHITSLRSVRIPVVCTLDQYTYFKDNCGVVFVLRSGLTVVITQW